MSITRFIGYGMLLYFCENENDDTNVKTVNMVEVFKTNVNDVEQASAISALLGARFELLGVSFDLEDCDRVLRVVGSAIAPEQIAEALYEYGFECSVME